MKFGSFFALFIFFAATVPEASHAQAAQSQRIPIAVFHNGSDALGMQLAQQLRMGFDESQAFELNIEADVLLILHTVGVNEEVSIISVIWVQKEHFEDEFPSYIESTLGFAGGDRLAQIGRGIIADSERVLREALPRISAAGR